MTLNDLLESVPGEPIVIVDGVGSTIQITQKIPVPSKATISIKDEIESFFNNDWSLKKYKDDQISFKYTSVNAGKPMAFAKGWTGTTNIMFHNFKIANVELTLVDSKVNITCDEDDYEQLFDNKPSAAELKILKSFDPKDVSESLITTYHYTADFYWQVYKGKSVYLKGMTRRTYVIESDYVHSKLLAQDSRDKREKLEQSGKLIDTIFKALKELQSGNTKNVFEGSRTLLVGDLKDVKILNKWTIVK